jgi:hypothetical protein
MSTTVQAIKELDSACQKMASLRGRPTIVMYYPPGATVTEGDMRDAYKELRSGGATKEQPLPQLDLFLHSYGGDPVAGYRIAQVLRTLCKKMDVLIPEHGYSAATLMSFAGDEIRLGDFAGLSPIDITVNTDSSSEGIQLAGIDSFREFAHDARQTMEKFLKQLQRQGAVSCVDSDLLVQMVKEIGALTVGRYYRERTLTGHYAQVLLESYMFRTAQDRRSRATTIIQNFLFGAPSHEFHLDYRLCKDWQLNVTEMTTDESDTAKAVLTVLRNCTEKGIICQKLNRRDRMPFIRYYRPTTRRRTSNARGAKKRTPKRTGNTSTAP